MALVVQGEGRGHLTQALALAAILTDAGHSVDRVLVGVNPYRRLPDYFTEGMPVPVSTFEAPTQVPGPDGRAASVGATLGDAARRMVGFWRGGFAIHGATRDADVVINLLDLVGGLSRFVLRTPTPAVAIAHNYLFGHPALADAPGPPLGRRLLRFYTGLTAIRCRARIALSFVPMSVPPVSRLSIAPPLLRPSLAQLDPHDGDYLLAYALNAGYGDRLAEWKRTRDDVTVHCYVDGGASALSTLPDGFFAHDLDEDAFLTHMAGCRAYVGSAGFESLCEAYYLGKPTLAVPTEGHLEQRWNAWDAERCGVARLGGYDDLDAFWDDPPRPDPAGVRAFRTWVARAPDMLLEVIDREATAGARHGRG